GDVYRVDVASVTGKLGASPLGPWKLSRERKAGRETTRLELHAGPPASSLTTISEPASTHVEVEIPRAHLHQLGLPSAPFGLAESDDPEIALTATFTEQRAEGQPATSEGNLDFRLVGMTIGFVPLPVELALGATWRGKSDGAAIERANF